MMIRYGIGSLHYVDGMSVVMGMFVIRSNRSGRMAGRMCSTCLLNRRARHADGRRYRMQRERGHQEPNQQCREQTVHMLNEYSTTVFAS